ncbi:AIR synthase-related protein [Methanoculleus thermophilus]|jgi:hydrogenase expression/formation protein|uniref:Hydrogenase expression/formation protein n=1 Tax=Methanoculleus thermophilus TaxID=2200 RepID=A0A1G8YSQ3_9EURY|nr:AIR synthase-related protein [Methanoculleus thermophilus]SDK05756.1 hydrogenase expression/formation protein [Methanoculleus thermophilus]HQD26087.1 AIR synthase-related protein [Methanoculleus thermophilus]
MDVEEFSRRHLAAGTPDDDIVRFLAEDILTIKRNRVTPAYAEAFARAVLTEAKNSTGLSGDLFTYEPSGSTMGEFGVGSRGSGDFFAHRQLARIIGRTKAAVGVDEMDDAGAVRADGDYIVITVDGMHSRLSDFPFLAGFHATRATLRDVYVMGAKPVALLSDIHVADDGDVAKIFDYTAGVSAVGEAMGVPLVTGSTLRIGGDMVLGSRMTGCVGAVGVARHLTARKQITPGDVLLMTEGAGGGTIATAAIYSGFPEVVEETINLHFLKACEALLASDVLSGIHAMTDVTNGGLRGDAYEMAETAGCRIVIVEDELRTLVQPKVLSMLDALEIDYLGVSLDALLVVAPPELAPEIQRVVASAGVVMKEVGYVEEGAPESVLSVNGEIRDFSPRFRESAYTPVKKVVDEDKRDFDEMKVGVERAAEAALQKKLRILSRLRSS